MMEVLIEPVFNPLNVGELSWRSENKIALLIEKWSSRKSYKKIWKHESAMMVLQSLPTPHFPSVLQAPNPQPHLPTETCPPTTPTLIDDATDQACGKSTSTLHVATASRDGH